MGIATASAAQYESAVKKLFPRGDYWDEQFSDPASDVSVFAKAKLDELIRFRHRMSGLRDESRIETTEELIADWERVLLGEVTYGKTLAERRLLLKSGEDNKLNRTELQKIADIYDLTIVGITFPYRPAFFGHAFFAVSFLTGPVGFSVPLITAVQDRAKFRARFAAGHQFDTTRFSRDRLACFPVYRLRQYLDKALRAVSAGFFKSGIQRLFPVYETRHDGPLSEFERRIVQENNFFIRLEKIVTDYMVREKRLFQDFEPAVQDKLLANQIPFFEYKGA